MTNETSELLDAIEDAGITVYWSERFCADVRNKVYLAVAIVADGQRWMVMGDCEENVVEELAEQLDGTYSA